MGWTSQGYNAQGFNPSLGFKSDYWYVVCNVDEDESIETYHEMPVDLGEFNEKVRIVYGTSSAEYFRGYVLTDDMGVAKYLLEKFNSSFQINLSSIGFQ